MRGLHKVDNCVPFYKRNLLIILLYSDDSSKRTKNYVGEKIYRYIW